MKNKDNRDLMSDLAERFRITLGLNSYEARVMMALALSASPQSVKDIAQASDVPIQRVYDVLEKLRRRGIVVQTATSPKTFTIRDLKSLLMEQLVRERLRFNEWQRKEIKRIQEESQRQLEYLEKEITSLLQLVQSIRGVTKAEPARIAVQIDGWKNIQETLLQLLRESEVSFWAVSRPPDWTDLTTLGILQPRELGEWYEAQDVRGVDIRWLTPRSAIPTFIGYMQATLLPRRLVEDERIPEKYVVIDNKRVLINLRNPVLGTNMASAVLIESQAVATVFSRFFQEMWKTAIPAQQAVSGYEKKLAEICERLQAEGFPELEIRVYRSLLRIGASTVRNIQVDLMWADKEDTPTIEEIENSLKRMIRRKIVKQHPVLKLYLPLLSEEMVGK